jgi:Cu+-exporting ATPase
MLLDKTGTITTCKVNVRWVSCAPDISEAEVLSIAGCVERFSEHPLARAIAAMDYEERAVDDFVNFPGLGAQATVTGQRISVGRPSWVLERTVALVPSWFTVATQVAGESGLAQVAIARGDQMIGLIALADTVRDTSAEAITALRALNVTPVLLSGDNPKVAERVAAQVGIDEVISDVHPADKVEAVRERQALGLVVAMVGDGVNDAAALAQADLGLAMSSGSDVAIEASDITLVRNDLVAAVDALRLSRSTLRVIKGNLFWAFAYNVAMIPLAAFGLLSPMLAGAAMAFSSVFVVANSLRLRRFRSLSRVTS